MMADEFDIKNPGIVTLSIKKMTKNFQLSRQKTVKILSFFHEKAKIKSTKTKSFFVEFNKTTATINCPRFKELCDEWTNKQLRSNSGETRDLLQSLETEVDKDKYIPPLPPKGGNNVGIKDYKYPDWLNMELWRDFKNMRSRIKKPITTKRTIDGLLKGLKLLMDAGNSQDDLIQTAIDSCWQKFYPPKIHNFNHQPQAEKRIPVE